MTDPRAVVDPAGNRIGVLLDVDEYERLVKASEMLDSLRARGEHKGSGSAYTPEESKIMKDRLQSLGYL